MASKKDGGRVHKRGKRAIERIFFSLKVDTSKPVLWFHCASVGEFNTAKDIILEFKDTHFIVLTYFSPRAKNYLQEQKSYYHLLHPIPLDLPPLIKKFEKAINPKALIVVERELWPSLITFTKTKKALINAYARGGILEKLLSRSFHLIITRTEEDKERFSSYGAKNVKSCGNLKFVMSHREKKVQVKANGTFIVAGSTHEGEEELILRVFMKLRESYKDLKLILVPRHIDRVKKLEGMLKDFNYSLRSEEKDGWDILLVDTLGELFYLYSLGKVCIVGGSFVNVGGHNLLEPLYWRKPVVFGPYTHKVKDMEAFLLKEGAGFKVRNEKELYKTLKELLQWNRQLSFNLKDYSQKVKNCYLNALREFVS